MLKLVLDTNTLISAFFWKGNEYELFKKIEKGGAKLFISKKIINEIKLVLNRPKFQEIIKLTNLTTNEIIKKVISVSHIVVGPKLNIKICRDPKDNKFLECAEHTKADYLVSGDKDLLVLKEYKGIKISRTSKILNLI